MPKKSKQKIKIASKTTITPRQSCRDPTLRSLMNKQRFNYSTGSATRVGDLPVGLLGRALIQHLPWGKRVQVEGVCTSWREEALAYGWEDVKHFNGWWEWNGGVLLHTDTREPHTYGWKNFFLKHLNWWWEWNDEVRIQPASWVPLISRAAPYLTTLDFNTVDQLSGDQLLAGLIACPKLKHLCLGWEQLTPPVLDHICRAYASTLKSLRLCILGRIILETAITFSETLTISDFTALEYLRVDGRPYEGEIPLFYSLPDTIRHLVLRSCELDRESFEGLASLPSLRSFTLWDVRMTGGMHLPALQRLTHLEHLSIEIISSDVENSIDAPPYLGASLKALLVQEWLSIRELRQLIPSIVAHSNRLEHLELWVEKAKQQEEAVEMEQLLGSLASPQLKSLRSLHFRIEEPSGWGWLERICLGHHQTLEYLEFSKAPPLATICNFVRECKRLSGLKMTGDHPLRNAADLIKLGEAAAAIGVNNGDEKGLKCDTLPTLCIACYGADEIQKAQIGINSSRLRFAHLNELWSQVLHQHRYGCLSEGRPAFEPFDRR